MSQEIYMTVVRLYFKCDLNQQDIMELMGDDLLKYEHQTEDGVQTFRYKSHVVDTIVRTELQAHRQTKQILDYK